MFKKTHVHVQASSIP